MRQTGRDLDVALAGPGYLTVQWQDGEAYTRSGSMAIDADGALTVSGHPVLGEGGPIVLPPYTALSIGADGTISVQIDGQTQMQVIDKLKLVRADAADLTKTRPG